MTEAVRPREEPTASSIPTAEEQRPQRTWIWFASILVTLVVLLALVWLAGGFERRTDVRTSIAPGTRITTGPYEFTFDSATVQKKEGFDDKVLWEVVVLGSGRVTGDEAMSPSTTNWFFAAQDPGTGQVVEPERQEFGPPAGGSGGSFFTPGLAAIPYRLVFQLPIELDQPSSIQLAVRELEYRDTTLLQTGELTWARANSFYRYDGLSVKRLPDDLR